MTQQLKEKIEKYSETIISDYKSGISIAKMMGRHKVSQYVVEEILKQARAAGHFFAPISKSKGKNAANVKSKMMATVCTKIHKKKIPKTTFITKGGKRVLPASTAEPAKPRDDTEPKNKTGFYTTKDFWLFSN